MYIRTHISNGYCGCDEDAYYEVRDANEAYELYEQDLELYGFLEPDERFIDTDSEEEYDEYQQGIHDYSYWEEITREEYEENT